MYLLAYNITGVTSNLKGTEQQKKLCYLTNAREDTD